MRSCPRCGFRIPEEVRACPRCASAPRPIPRQNLTKAPAWELAVVLVFIALAIGTNLLAKQFVSAGVAALIVLGLLFRTGWAFWFAVVASLLGIPLSFYVFENPASIAITIGSDLLIAGLLISSKVRGAY